MASMKASDIRRFRLVTTEKGEDVLKIRSTPDGVNVNLIDPRTGLPLPPAKKRGMLPLNLVDPSVSFGLFHTGTGGNGLTVSAPVVAPSGLIYGDYLHATLTCSATSTGNTVRAWGGSPSMTLSTSSYYEASVTVADVQITNPAACVAGWFGLAGAVTEGTQKLVMPATVPVKGQRYSIRFKPTSASNILRAGLGIDVAETATNGDFIKFTDFSVYPINALTDSVVDYAFNAYGPVGKAQSAPASPGSCLLCIGDSWSDAPVYDWPGVLATTYQREVRPLAAAGNQMDVMMSRVLNAQSVGLPWLLGTKGNIPGVGVIVGGINDLINNVTITNMIARAQTLIDNERAHNRIPLFVLQPFATNSSYYTAGLATIRAQFASYIAREGVDYIDLAQQGYLNADGTANTTYMQSQSGIWIHPTDQISNPGSTDNGVIKLVGLIETWLRSVDQASRLILTPATWP